MENPEEVLQLLERFTKLKQKEIPRELDDYLGFVARTGDTVYRWAIVKHLFREKLLHVITDFRDTTPSIAELPQCPNVDPFNYERTKRILLDRLDAFNSAPFTVQRICELLTEPRKQYTRIDKFMRAVEKNILVVSTQEPGRRRSDSENGDSLDSIVNGELEVNVDIEMDNDAFAVAETSEMIPTSARTSSSSSTPTTTPLEELSSASSVAPDHDVSKEADAAADTTNGDTTPSPINNDSADKDPCISTTKQENEKDEDVPKSLEDNLESPDVAGENSEAKPVEIPAENNDPIVPPTSETADNSTTEETQPLDLIHPVVPQEPQFSSEFQSAEEVHDNTGVTVQEPAVTAAAQCPVPVGSVDASEADDDQPQAKLAKFSHDEHEQQVALDAVPSKENVEPEGTPDVLSTEKDDTISGSTTDSGSSSTSIDSEPISSSTDASTSTSAESVESFGSTPNNLQTTAAPVSDAVEDTQAVDVAKETVAVIAPETSEAIQEEPVEPSVECSVKSPAPQDLLPKEVDLAVPADEMETAASAMLVSEMATDEEETVQSSSDAVIPMAADVPETTKPDENAMDVDESSAEPMDQ